MMKGAAAFDDFWANIRYYSHHATHHPAGLLDGASQAALHSALQRVEDGEEDEEGDGPVDSAAMAEGMLEVCVVFWMILDVYIVLLPCMREPDRPYLFTPSPSPSPGVPRFPAGRAPRSLGGAAAVPLRH